MTLYKSLVRPHMDYCSTTWRPHLQKDILRLEKVQRRFTKVIQDCRNMSYEHRLQTLKITTLETRRMRADMLQMFRILKGIDKVESKNFFNLNQLPRSSTLRGHNYKITKNRFHKDLGKFSFKNRTINTWNKLPQHIINSESINIFKNKIDVYLKNLLGN